MSIVKFAIFKLTPILQLFGSFHEFALNMFDDLQLTY